MATKKILKTSTEAAPQTSIPQETPAKPAKKAAKKAAKSPASPVAKKSPSSPAVKTISKPVVAKISPDDIARAAYLNYRLRVEQGLPGDSHGDWLEAEKSLEKELGA